MEGSGNNKATHGEGGVHEAKNAWSTSPRRLTPREISGGPDIVVIIGENKTHWRDMLLALLTTSGRCVSLSGTCR